MVNNYLNDEQYLQQYINCVNFIFSEADAGIVFIKDMNFKYRTISKGLNLLGGEAGFTDIIGKSDYQVTALQEYPGVSDAIRAQDIKVQRTKKRQFFLHITHAKNAFIVRKHSIVNPHTGNFVGIHGHMSNFVLLHPIKAIYEINSIHKTINIASEPPLSYELTERQHMILFLYLHKYSYTEIAEIMTTLGFKVSASRVNDHLSNLKYIFQIKTKHELIEKALGMNYHLYIPRKFLKVGTYAIDGEMIISD